MNSIKIVHTADLHLINPDTITDKVRKQLANDSLLVFYSIIDFCKEYKPDVLLICGDLFSVHNEQSSFVMQVFEKFREIPFLKVVITPGNHDFLSSTSPYNTIKQPENVHIFSTFSKFTIKENNTNIYGYGFTSRFVNESILEPAKDFESINICAIHGDVTNSLSEYNPITLQAINNSGFEYIALGHIHSFSGIKNIGKTYYAYPGTPQGQGYDEKGEKGIIFGEISKEFVNLEFKKMSKRMINEISFDISSYQQASEAFYVIMKHLEEKNGEEFRDNLYRINLTGKYKENHLAYINYISENLSNNLFYCEINDLTKPDIDMLKSFTNDTSIKGIYLKKMLNIIENCDEITLKTANKALYIGLEVLDNDN